MRDPGNEVGNVPTLHLHTLRTAVLYKERLYLYGGESIKPSLDTQTDSIRAKLFT